MSYKENPPDFVMIFQAEYHEILDAYPLSEQQYRLLSMCIIQCEYGGGIRFSTSELGRLIGIDQPAASRAMQVLVDAGYVLREKVRANRYRYWLPATLFWRGKLEAKWEQQRPKDHALQLMQRLAAKRDSS